MFPKKSQTPKSNIEIAIDSAFEELKGHDANSDEYAQIVKQIETLHGLLPEKKKRVDVNNLLAVGGNLAGIGMILGYERAHVVASKALGFVVKTKL